MLIRIFKKVYDLVIFCANGHSYKTDEWTLRSLMKMLNFKRVCSKCLKKYIGFKMVI